MNNWIEAVKKPLEMITGRHAGARPEEPGAELVKPEQLQPRRAESSSVARRAAKGPKARDILGPAQKKPATLLVTNWTARLPRGIHSPRGPVVKASTSSSIRRTVAR